jgi:hypothetical protein
MSSRFQGHSAPLARALDLRTEFNNAFIPSVRRSVPSSRWNLSSLEGEHFRLNSFARQAFDPGFLFAAFPVPAADPRADLPRPPIDHPHRISPTIPKKLPKAARKRSPDFDFPMEDLIAMSPRRRTSRSVRKAPASPKVEPKVAANVELDEDLDRFVDEIDTMRRW